MSHKFNHSVLASKAICISFLREFGVAKDWTRVTIGEMRRMLASYADERLFDAAKRIVERDGDTFVREEFETSIDDDDTTVEVETIDVDQGDTRTVETVELEREVAKPKAKAKQAEQAPQPQAQAQAQSPDVGAVAAMLTQLLAAGRQSVNTEQVEEIAKRVADRATAALSADLLHAMGVLVDEAVKGIAPRQIGPPLAHISVSQSQARSPLPIPVVHCLIAGQCFAPGFDGVIPAHIMCRHQCRTMRTFCRGAQRRNARGRITGTTRDKQQQQDYQPSHHVLLLSAGFQAPVLQAAPASVFC